MSWTEVTPITRGMRITSVRYGAREKKGRRVVLPEAVRLELGWERGTAVVLAIGSGEHAGMIALKAAPHGSLALRKASGKHSAYVPLGQVPGLSERQTGLIDVAHVIVDGSLQITLPPDAFAATPMRESAPRPAPPATKRNIVDEVVGGKVSPRRYATQSGVRP